MSFQHHLSTGGAAPSDVFPQRVRELEDDFSKHVRECESGDFFADNEEIPRTSPPSYRQPGRCRHDNRVGSARGGEHICGKCEDGEPEQEPDDIEDVGDCGICGEGQDEFESFGQFWDAENETYLVAHGQCGEDGGYPLG